MSIIDIAINIKNIKILRIPHCNIFVEENIFFFVIYYLIYIYLGAQPLNENSFKRQQLDAITLILHD